MYKMLKCVSVHRGAGPGCNTQEMADRLSQLKTEIDKLEEHERILDVRKMVSNVFVITLILS